MKKQVFRLDSDGFNGAWYPASSENGRGLIIMLGDSSEDRMAKTGAKWLNEQGIHVMAMSPDIQSAFAMPDERKMQQEQRPLIHTGDGLKKIIITKTHWLRCITRKASWL